VEKSADKPDTSHDSSSLSPYFLTHLVCLNHLGVELSCSKEEEEDKGECAVSPFAPSPLSYIGGATGVQLAICSYSLRSQLGSAKWKLEAVGPTRPSAN